LEDGCFYTAARYFKDKSSCTKKMREKIQRPNTMEEVHKIGALKNKSQIEKCQHICKKVKEVI